MTRERLHLRSPEKHPEQIIKGNLLYVQSYPVSTSKKKPLEFLLLGVKVGPETISESPRSAFGIYSRIARLPSDIVKELEIPLHQQEKKEVRVYVQKDEKIHEFIKLLEQDELISAVGVSSREFPHMQELSPEVIIARSIRSLSGIYERPYLLEKRDPDHLMAHFEYVYSQILSQQTPS